MSRLQPFVASVFVLLFGVANAQSTSDSTSTRKPLDQGISSVEKNLEKNPDNKGLRNAKERLQENQERFEARKAERAERLAQRPDRPERAERAERPERPERADRGGR